LRNLLIRPGNGFSLLELMIVMAIVAILLTLATPAFQTFSMRSHRTVAISDLLQIASCQERIRAIKGLYDTSVCLPANNQHYHYDYDVPNVSSTESFKAMAGPVGSQQKDKCGSIMLSQNGYREISGVGEDIDSCWAGR
jgi:type IV pilus assembly protein PilE